MYAKVVLENLLSQTSVYELEEELKKGYPNGLDEAYDRIADRVLERAPNRQKEAASQILALVACAARRLRWREIQCYFCIDVAQGSCNYRKKKNNGPKELCSSFVEVAACTLFPDSTMEAYVVMVHHTATR